LKPDNACALDVTSNGGNHEENAKTKEGPQTAGPTEGANQVDPVLNNESASNGVVESNKKATDNLNPEAAIHGTGHAVNNATNTQAEESEPTVTADRTGKANLNRKRDFACCAFCWCAPSLRFRPACLACLCFVFSLVLVVCDTTHY
jgi:hypothetical protein